ncbi:MAG: peptidase M1 [Bacteroidetes bacterium]|nr:MAG: peptidase M1 [Bacteroidota bacterium]
MKKTLILAGLISLSPLLRSQPDAHYWQQAVDYKMQVDLNPENHRFTGKQNLTYYNNSPDTLKVLFYHLYFNAFQPNSMMDVRSRNLPDPDKRVGSRIEKLGKDEQGEQEVISLSLNGTACFFENHQTLLKVLLPSPILPGDTALLEMEFRGQVPVQIRRSGRDNKEGVDYTMTQWYPKMAAYDENGWHADPYVAREYYAPYGTFEVDITLPSQYRVAATGTLQNFANYWQEESREEDLILYNLIESKEKTRSWKFRAENVHDFAWAADPEYLHEAQEFNKDLMLHFFYLEDNKENWHRLPRYTQQFFKEMNQRFGRYAYPQFSVIQGGDGGMEYPMCTMLKGTGNIAGLVGVTVHEGAHNWYYGMIGSNENSYPWMDEGFTTFAEEEVLNAMAREPKANPHAGAFSNHNYLARQGAFFEPLTTPADYFSTNMAYGINSYSRGSLFLVQLRYIIGEETFNKTMLDFFKAWQFKHPKPSDMLRSMERASGLQLDWFYHNWVETTKTIDYGFKEIEGKKQGTEIVLEKLGEMPMPLRIKITLKEGIEQRYYIPTASQMGAPDEEGWQVLSPWPWTHPEYEAFLQVNFKDIAKIEIDPGGFMADVNRANNSYPQEEGE